MQQSREPSLAALGTSVLGAFISGSRDHTDAAAPPRNRSARARARGGDFTGVNFGIRGEDFVLLAAETGHRKGPLQYAADGSGAIRRVDEGAVLSCVGHQGEADDLAAFLRSR